MIKRIYFFVLVSSLSLALLFGISWLNTRSILSLEEHGGWKVMKSKEIYNYFKKNDKDKNFRVISIYENPKPSFIYLNKINTFDGMRYNHSINKSLFFSISLKLNPDRLLKERHRIKDPQNIDYNMLAMANVKYILSGKKLSNKNLDFLKMLVFQNNNFIKEIFIYKTKLKSWGLVFTPNRALKSDYKSSDPNYYLDLKKLNFREVLVNEKINFLNFNLKLIDFKLNGNNYNISLNGAKGHIVLNQIFNKNIFASCNEEKLETLSINGIMTMIKIPKGCKKLLISVKKKKRDFINFLLQN